MKVEGLSGSFWPTPAQEALLRLVLGSDDRVVERWQELQPLDLDALEEGAFGLLPFLHGRLSGVGVEDPLLPRLAGTYRSTWYRTQLRLKRLSGVVSALRDAEIDAIVFGAAALATLWYAQPGFRPIAQLDLIVPPDAAPTARQVALAAGWRDSGGTRAHSRFVDPDGAVLVLHEGVPPYLVGPVDPESAHRMFLAAAREREVGSSLVSTLDPADELLFVCSLGARTAMVPSIQWLLDAAQVLASPNRPQPASLIQRAVSFRLIPSLRATVAYLDEVAETLDLDELAARLQSARVPARDLLAFRLNGGVGGVGIASQTLADHVRATAGEPLPHALARLPSHLQTAWGLESVSRVPWAVLRKLIGRTRRPPIPPSGPAARQTGARAPARPGDDPPSARKHSALS